MAGLFFLSPLFLWGLAAVSIPVIIHLIHTRKAKVKPFSSFRFLRLSYRRTAKRSKLTNRSEEHTSELQSH